MLTLQQVKLPVSHTREDLEKMEKQEADWRAQSEKLTDTNEKIAVWKGKNQELEVLGIEVQETEDLLKGVRNTEKTGEESTRDIPEE